METSQEKLEQGLMNLLLQGEHPILNILRQQYASARVVSRSFTGYGFYTHYGILKTVPLVEPQNFAAGNVNIQLEGVLNGAGCVLFIRDGRLSFLECYTFDDPWPDQIMIKSLSEAIPAIP
ncbi:MAG: hypothetical protein A2136_08600 [Chloroflexi bacterium RBG_16_54_11]|nr:MAG: hypothetical protein A2136_08600 [Chloroflexi bacterium RBG_16_54_11]